MILILIAALIAILSTSMFLVIYQVNGINRAIISMPISILEPCVPVDHPEEKPVFDKEKVIEELTYYYNYMIPKYTTNYEVKYYFYNTENESFCVGEDCSAIEISVEAILMYDYHYKRVMYYEIFGAK